MSKKYWVSFIGNNQNKLWDSNFRGKCVKNPEFIHLCDIECIYAKARKLGVKQIEVRYIKPLK